MKPVMGRSNYSRPRLFFGLHPDCIRPGHKKKRPRVIVRLVPPPAWSLHPPVGRAAVPFQLSSIHPPTALSPRPDVSHQL